MDPIGTGRVRGFRRPGPDEIEPASADVSAAARPGAPSAGPAAPADRFGPSQSRRWFLGACAALIVAVIVIAGLAFRLGSSSATSGAKQSPAAAAASATPAATAAPLATTDLYTRVAPSVVLITTSKGSLGSGTIVTDTGTILTADHVVSGGGAVSLLFSDGTRSTATVASANPKNDTATLVPAKLPEVVVAATLGGGAVVGQDVVAIGNPLGLRDSTSTGVVSGVDRVDKTAAGTVTGLIQFDAAVNPGSSGGPLLDDQGNVIGVVLSIADPGNDDAFAGIGFAVSISSALNSGSDGPGQGAPQL